MKRFVYSIELALQARDWYGALSSALIFPDICARMEAPNRKSKDRYIDWFNRYLLHFYSMEMGPGEEKHIFLRGDDCYALRCSYLHEGSGSIVDQLARKALDSFHFITPPNNGNMVHMNQKNDVLQLQIDIFCRQMCAAVDKWENEIVKGNIDIEKRLNSLLEIHDSDKGIIF